KGTFGRYVRIELPGRRKTLTLAEVEVYSDGKNVALQGKASQKNTANGGIASRAIDGNKAGEYSRDGQTHTEEETANPWWEVDLGAEFPIDSIVIYNRTDEGAGKRLNNFALKILDNTRHAVYQKLKQPGPLRSATYEVGGGSEGNLRRAAMMALTSVRGQEEQTFKALAGFARQGTDRAVAI